MDLYNESNKYQQTIMISTAFNKHSSSFLTCVPTNHSTDYRMKDEQFTLSIRHRLGLIPYESMINDECSSCLESRNKELPHFIDDLDHLHSCLKHTGASVDRRHERVVEVVTKLVKSVGYHTIHELAFPPRFIPVLDPITKVTTTKIKRSLERGDILLIRGNQVILIDVSVTRPTSLTNLQRLADINSRPLAVAEKRERKKHNKYDDECEYHQWKFIPFVLESYGSLGSEGEKLLKQFSELSDSPCEFLSEVRSLLSVALQCGNADISSSGAAEFLHSKYILSVNDGPHKHDQFQVELDTGFRGA